MHIYNIVVIIGFVGFMTLLYLRPPVQEALGLRVGDPLLFSLAVPLLLVLAGNSVLSLNDPERGYDQMIAQVLYKPFAIILFWVFTVLGKIPLILSVVLTLGLLIYIAGNLKALRERTDWDGRKPEAPRE